MNKFENIVSKVLGIEENSVKDHLSRGDIGGWDSMNHLILISELENGFDVRFNESDIERVERLGDFRDALRRRGADGL